MSELIGKQHDNEEQDDQELSKASLQRHLQQRGQEQEMLSLLCNNLRNRQQYIYKVEVRSPNKKSSEWLCLVKMLSPEGAYIAFNSGGSMMTALMGVGRKLQGGTLEWHEDGYPPDDVVERLAYLDKNASWLWF